MTPRGAVRGAHGVVVVSAGQIRTDRIEDGAIVFNHDDATVRAGARAVEGDHPEGALGGGGLHVVRRERHGTGAEDGAVVEPRQHLLGLGHHTQAGGAVSAALAHGGETDAATGAEHDGGKTTTPILIVELPPAAVVLVDTCDGQTQHARAENLVGIELRALAAPGAGRVAEVDAVPARLGDLGGLVDHAAGGTDAEENTVGPRLSS